MKVFGTSTSYQTNGNGDLFLEYQSSVRQCECHYAAIVWREYLQFAFAPTLTQVLGPSSPVGDTVIKSVSFIKIFQGRQL